MSGAGMSPDWPALPPGTPLTVVKLAPDESEAARYPGTVLAAAAPPPWLTVATEWTLPPMALDGLVLEPGDRLHEYFSPAHPFNSFAVFGPDGRPRGAYANVAHPARLDLTANPPILIWHDLFVDVIALPDGTVVVRDEDELAAANIAADAPDLYALIASARDELLRRAAARLFPFVACQED